MNLFDINNNIRAFLDQLYSSVDDTGEITQGDWEALEELTEARDTKIENIALYIKEMEAQAEAIKAEADRLTARAKSAQKKADRLRAYLTMNLQRESMDKFETSRCQISFRKSEVVSIPDENYLPKKYLTKKVTYAPDKKAIKEELKAGKAVRGATIITKQNIQIK